MSNIPEKPKRPPTTYFAFQAKWIEARKDKGEKVDRAQIKEDWENIDEEEKNKLQAEFDEKNEQYKKELAAWEEKYGEKKPGSDIPPKPKKPMNYYFHFRQQYIQKCKDNDESYEKDDIQEAWKKVSESEKEKFAEDQKPELEKWKAEIAEWENEYGDLYKKAQEQKKKEQEKKKKTKKNKKTKQDDSDDEDDEEEEKTKRPKKSNQKKRAK